MKEVLDANLVTLTTAKLPDSVPTTTLVPSRVTSMQVDLNLETFTDDVITWVSAFQWLRWQKSWWWLVARKSAELVPDND